MEFKNIRELLDHITMLYGTNEEVVKTAIFSYLVGMNDDWIVRGDLMMEVNNIFNLYFNKK